MADSYPTVYDYFSCGTTTTEKIAKIDSILDGLYDAAANFAANSHIEEYRLDDGQTIIKTVYRTMEDITKAILKFERLRNMLINRNCIGRVIKLRDRDSFLLNR